MMSADSATEDHGDLVGLADCSIGVQQSFAEPVQRRAAMKDEVTPSFGKCVEQLGLCFPVDTGPVSQLSDTRDQQCQSTRLH